MFVTVNIAQFLSIASVLLTGVHAVSVTNAVTTILGVDPEGPQRLNGGSFQQDAITTFRGWYVFICIYFVFVCYNPPNYVNTEPIGNMLPSIMPQVPTHVTT